MIAIDGYAADWQLLRVSFNFPVNVTVVGLRFGVSQITIRQEKIAAERKAVTFLISFLTLAIFKPE